MSTRSKFSKYNLLTGLSVCVGVLLLVLTSMNLKSGTSDERHPSLLAPKNMKMFALGYNEIVADSLWLRTIQDFDYCERRPEGSVDPNAFRCDRGWVFHMIDAITELAPNFRQPYISGALMLSILVNDIHGASEIFDKAVRQFPSDGQILYNAAYQAMVEEHDDAKASRLLIESGKNGAPPWVFALAAKLQQKAGQLEFAKSILSEALELNPTGPGAERIQQRLDEVNAELAKQPQQ